MARNPPVDHARNVHLGTLLLLREANVTIRFSDLRRQRDPRRLQARKDISSRRWKKVRALKLSENPLCERCLHLHNRPVPAVHVHHIKSRLDRPDLTFAMSNLMSLCVQCHAEVERGG